LTPGIELLEVQARTLFLLSHDERIDRENDPDRSPGPALWMAGCGLGNVLRLGTDIVDEIAAKIETLAESEPPLAGAESRPQHLDRYLDMLGDGVAPMQATQELIYELPHALACKGGATLIASDSPEGQDLVQALSRRGMPEGLSSLGFRQIEDLWQPWCAAMVDGRIASLAFAARLSGVGAELGLVTVKDLRGQGFAAAATAGWSSLPMLRSRALFYSTSRTNLSSQRVVAHLGLRFIGTSFRIAPLAPGAEPP
jgi:hypothetical protein